MAAHTEVARYARGLMNEHGLGHWSFGFDKARNRFGCCNYTLRTITLSEHIVGVNTLDRCIETVQHEVAHALAGYDAAHGPVWKTHARAVGLANPKRCCSVADVAAVAKYRGFCSGCGDEPMAVRQQAPTTPFTCRKHRKAITWRDRSGREVLVIAKPRKGTTVYTIVCTSCGHIGEVAKRVVRPSTHNVCGMPVQFIPKSLVSSY
jgi:SprT protein